MGFEFDRGEVAMNGLIIKDIQFNGSTLRAAQDAENIIWVGVRWVCQGLGLSNDRMKYERKKIQKDLVLVQGVKFYPLGTDDANSDILCLKLDFLPLWLAKIRITPTIKKENPDLAERLVDYQLKAKDVLAAAFLNKEILEPISQTVPMEDFKRLESKLDKMYADMAKLANIILDIKDKATPVLLPENVKTKIGVNDTARKWKSDMYDKMDRIYPCTNKFNGRADIMKYIYKYMNKNYGIVWEQEIKDYRDYTGINNASTIDVVAHKDMFRSIFQAVVIDLEYKYTRCADKSIEERISWVDEVIQPLVDKYSDHSNAGMATYRRVYKKMDEQSKIAWNNLTTRYINSYGKKPSRKDLIITRQSLKKKFKNAVKELMEE